MEKEFQKLKLKSGNLSTVHEFDERNTLTKENIKLLEKSKFLQKYMENEDNDDDYDDDDYDDDYDIDDFEKRNKYINNHNHFDTANDFEDINIDHKIKNRIDLLHHETNKNIGQTIRPKNSKHTLKSNLSTPMGSKMYVMTGVHHGQEDDSNGSTLSSRTPSSIHSQYSESDTENSDYAADFDDLDDNNGNDKVNLLQNFQRKQMEARRRAEDEKKMHQSRYNQTKDKYNQYNTKISNNYIETNNAYNVDDITNDEDFENLNVIDPSKLYRFRKKSSPISIGKKKSLPVMRMATGFNGSPKKIKKYLSTIDINSNLDEVIPNSYPSSYMGPELDRFNELDNIDDFDLTITLSDYNKLKKKSRKIDFNRYAEIPPQHQHRYQREDQTHYQQYNNNSNSQTSRLTREGKIRLIRSLGKPKVRKVMPAHIYGEIIYDPKLKKWCGNEEDLLRFDTIYPKLQLIPKKESLPQIIGNMVYDDKKLRWVSVTGNYEDDPFGADFDTVINQESGKEKQKYNNSRVGIPRGVSTKLIPSSSSIIDNIKKNEYYKVTPEMYKQWKSEESRWMRKVNNWFPFDGDIHKFKYELKTFLNQQ